MSNLKTVSRVLMTGVACMALAACGADDVASPGEGVIVNPPPPAPPPPPPPPPPTTPTGPAASCPAGTANVGIVNNLRNCQISGTITGNLTLAALPGTIYSLSGGVRVGNDVGGDGTRPGGSSAILTIEPGVVLFGSSGADFLLINRGSQLFAEGTATRPIVLTSRANVEGTSTDSSIGQWGGLVILGRAPINTCIGAGVTPGTAACEGAVEGTNNGFYGGALPADNSGRIRYLQVRYPGFEVLPGNELNGITLGGVGRGTVIDHIQVHNSSDDGIEWFGGTVNQAFIALTGIDDDALDTDLGFKGYTQFVYTNQRTGGGDRTIEADTTGNELKVPRSHPRLANFTFVHNRATDAILLRGGTDYTLVNGVIANTGGQQCLDVDDNQTASTTVDTALDEIGAPVFRSVMFACSGDVENDSNVNAATVTPFITGNNNLLGAVNSLTALFTGGPLGLNGATETGVTATNPTTFNTAGAGNFFVATTYIGAIRNSTDTWYVGWTCGLTSTSACTTAPTPILS